MPFSGTDITAALLALGQSDFAGLQLLAAPDVAGQHYPRLDPGQPVLLLGLTDPDLARRLATTLLLAYPAEHPVILLAAGQRHARTLNDLTLPPPLAPGAHLFLPPRAGAATFETLQDVVARLRGPDGCPWDRALTWEKLRPSLLEETYELLAALDADDARKVLEEQGDLLLQIALQAQIAHEEGRYRLPDVITHIVEKLIRRHPHVFGSAQVSNADEVLANWEAIKAAERAQNGEKRSPLAGIPAGLPALAQAEAYLDRMSRLRPAAPPQRPTPADLLPAAPLTAAALGEALFGLVAWALAHGIEAESALRQANARFADQVAAEGWG